jgi:hypothetical protein
MSPEGWLYRGLHAGHPAFSEAVKGICAPGDPAGTITPRRHNDGGAQAISPYTSWTRVRLVAVKFADRFGPGGVILVASAGASTDPSSWRWEASDDDWWENEVLLWGTRSGLTVEVP